MDLQGPKSQDPLEILQLMVNDVLVQTGKALRTSRKDGQANVAVHAHSILQTKLPDSIYTFHCALDDIENEIIRAKSVLLRDLNQIREQKQQQELLEQQQKQETLLQQEHHQPIQEPQPQPIESQSKEPIVLDLDSSPPPNDQPMVETKATKPVAPFPDMGMGMPDLGHTDIMKSEPPSMTPTTTTGPLAATAPMAPMPDMDEKPMDLTMDLSGGDLSNQELSFTNMQFTLASSNNDGQNPQTTQDPSFDLTTFAPTEGGDDLMALEHLLPPNPNDQSSTGPSATTKVENLNSTNNQPNHEQLLVHDFGTLKKQETGGDSTFDDILMDTDGGDFGGMDGLGEDTFNDLMVDRDDTSFDMMEHGSFDTSYFGIDSTD